MTTQIKVTSIYPTDKPDFNTWCNMFKVSSRLTKDDTPLTNAQRIMELWNGWDNMKEKFIKRMRTEEF